MRASTLKIVEAAIVADETISPSQVRGVLRVLSGDLAADSKQSDECVPRSKVARMMGVCPATVTLYGKRGVIRPIRLGEKGERAVGYSLLSIQEAMARR